MAESTSARVERVSIDDQPTSDWWGADLRERDGRYRFRTFHEGRFRLEVGLSCHGRRYVEAALAAIAACHLLEIGSRPIREALEEYLGASRAFDMKGTYRGVTMIDDDAVEPSDVAETLALARMIYGGRRLWAVYASRESSRVPVAGFESADHVLFVGAAPETADCPSFVDTSPSNSRRARVGYAADRDEAVRDLDRLLEPGDVLVTLGTSDTGTIADAFIRRLPRDRRAR
jgi:UDP-N-acetylmuramate-alanine ligase